MRYAILTIFLFLAATTLTVAQPPLRWEQKLGSASNSQVEGIASDSSGNVFVVRAVTGKLCRGVIGKCECFIAKYDRDDNSTLREDECLSE